MGKDGNEIGQFDREYALFIEVLNQLIFTIPDA